jgi:hypothetical protein
LSISAHRISIALTAALGLVSACSFDPAGRPAVDTAALDYGISDLLGDLTAVADNTGFDGAPPDGAIPYDTVTPVTDGARSDQNTGPCVTGELQCLAGGSARVCVNGTWTTLGDCPLGCSPTTKACRVPSNVPPDAITKGTDPLLLSDAVTTIDTDTGEISGLRPAGTGLDPSSGIYYAQVGQSAPVGLGVFAAKTIDIPLGITLKVKGSRALVLLASESAQVQGTIDAIATGQIAGSGGFAGGAGNQPGKGSCGGQVGKGDFDGNSCGSGSGGGGHGGSGGDGGDSTCASPKNHQGGSGGANTCGSADLVPLVGGSGGAGAGPLVGASSPDPSLGPGGGGGGAVQISAGVSIKVGPGGINAGGDGGGQSTSAGGAGGGAGGAILLEAPKVALNTGGTLAANGGGGGGGDCH